MMSEDRLREVENMIREAQLNAEKEKLRNTQQEIMLAPQERSMITEQLSLGEELERIDYLLKGYTMEINDDTGESRWVKPSDTDMIVLSEYGIHLIRNTIAWYLNKNTLLSNYDTETILEKMEDFASDLNDTIFMEYEKIFQYPTLEDCKKVLRDRLDKRVELKRFVCEIMKKELSEEEKKKIEKDVIEEMEPMIEKELRKIKEQVIKNKLKRFLLIIREVQDAVHSTYLRAWMGQERKTLREHIHISESKGGIMIPQQSGGFNPFALLKRRK